MNQSNKEKTNGVLSDEEQIDEKNGSASYSHMSLSYARGHMASVMCVASQEKNYWEECCIKKNKIQWKQKNYRLDSHLL